MIDPPDGIDCDALYALPEGAITEDGLRENIRVGIQYIEAWLRGSGCVPLYNLMEDAATAEISRSQVWQWLHHGALLEDGRIVTEPLFRRLVRPRDRAIHDDERRRRFRTLPDHPGLPPHRADG